MQPESESPSRLTLHFVHNMELLPHIPHIPGTPASSIGPIFPNSVHIHKTKLCSSAGLHSVLLRVLLLARGLSRERPWHGAALLAAATIHDSIMQASHVLGVYALKRGVRDCGTAFRASADSTAGVPGDGCEDNV